MEDMKQTENNINWYKESKNTGVQFGLNERIEFKINV